MTPSDPAGVEATAREIVAGCDHVGFRSDQDYWHAAYEKPGACEDCIAAALRAAPPSGLTPPRPRDAPLSMPADRSALIARAIAADDAEVSVSGAATAEYSAEEMDRLARGGAGAMSGVNVAAFWERVNRLGPDDCWPWTGAVLRARGGYGTFWSGKGGERRAHRIAWTLTHGAIPEGQVVMHRCDNPPCCNPAHLTLGTRTDNNRDAIAKGRARNWQSKAATCKRGHPFDGIERRRSKKSYRRCSVCVRLKNQRIKEKRG